MHLFFFLASDCELRHRNLLFAREMYGPISFRKKKLLPMVIQSQAPNLVFYFECLAATYLFLFKSSHQSFQVNHFHVTSLDSPVFPLDISVKYVILDQFKIRPQCLGIKYRIAVLTFYELELSCKTLYVDFGEDCF